MIERDKQAIKSLVKLELTPPALKIHFDVDEGLIVDGPRRGSIPRSIEPHIQDTVDVWM